VTLRVLVAPAPFKGALGAPDAARAITAGIRLAEPEATITTLPIADGGEGTRDAVVEALDGRTRAFTVDDPLGRPVSAAIGLVPGAEPLAVVELAAASGYERLTDDERDAEATSTFGTGELIRAALDFNPGTLVVALGGSATNDAGLGLLRALGARILDADGRELVGRGADLGAVRRIDLDRCDPRLRDVTIRVACDVTNPFTGPRGAAAVFGPQKGADADAVARLDAGLDRIATVLAGMTGVEIADLPGAGAAGGVAGTLVALFGATIESGADLVLDLVGVDAAIEVADLVLTGEGSLDEQSLHGKAPVVLAGRARARNVPCVALCGRVALGPRRVAEAGLVAAFTIGGGMPDADPLAETRRDLARTAAMVTRLRAY